MHATPALFALILISAISSFASDQLPPSPQPIQGAGHTATPLSAQSAAEPAPRAAQVWTLQSSIQRGLMVAPELRAAEAEIAARTGGLTEVAAWPNPSVALRADQRLGLEDGRGGYDLSQVTINQPLPLNRLEHQRRAAEAGLAAARAAQRYQRLLLETRTAQAFHALQQAAGRQLLAQERLGFAEKM